MSLTLLLTLAAAAQDAQAIQPVPLEPPSHDEVTAPEPQDSAVPS